MEAPKTPVAFIRSSAHYNKYCQFVSKQESLSRFDFSQHYSLQNVIVDRNVLQKSANTENTSVYSLHFILLTIQIQFHFK